MFKRVSSNAPIVGIVTALLLYFYAASLYSAATTLDPADAGYHHFRNYWCDLYVPVTYTGQANPGRPYALAATLILATSLLFFWLCVPLLFVEHTLLSRTVRWGGAIAVIAGALVYTSLHNLVIALAAPLGFAAVLATCTGLAKKREWRLLALGAAAVAVAISDYLIWILGLMRPWQPGIQKVAFVMIFLWVLVTALKVRSLAPVRPS
ncbi:MAG TPA: hypothetical protein VHM90_14095 [Phycisphaerae bacterium]|nr:hypothetical protein [Phycisphaerae bacterium]